MTGRFAFTDLVSGRVCELVVPEGGAVFPREGQPKTGIMHPGCGTVADLAVMLDAFWCPDGKTT